MRVEVFYQETGQKEAFEIEATTCIIGRSNKADVTVHSEALSRQHCQLDEINGDLFLTDLNSTNGVTVNGTRIPTGVKTPYKPMFPMEIGDITITVSQEVPEERPPSFAQAVKSATPLELDKPSRGASSKTKSIRKRDLEEKDEDKSSGALNPAALGVGIIAILGIGYFFLSGKSTTTEQAPEAAPVTLTEISKEPPKLVDVKADELNLKALFETNECSLYGPLCSQIGLTHGKERLVLADNKLIVFVDVDAFNVNEASTEFKNLSEKDRTEVMLARVATHPALADFLKEKNPNLLLVAGYSSIDDMTRFKYLLNVSFREAPEMEKEFHDFIFGEIFASGSVRKFKKFIGYYMRLTEL